MPKYSAVYGITWMLLSLPHSNAFLVGRGGVSSFSTRVYSTTDDNQVSTSSSVSDAEKQVLVSPDSIPTDNVPELFEQKVQKTYGRYPITITSGSGTKLYDETGKQYLDFVAGIATCALGHANPILNKAITDQISSLHHVSNLYYTPSQGQLAAWLVANSCADKAFFCNSGAEANEGAIKLARKHASLQGITDPIIITAKQSFHGRTLATITATGQPKYHEGFKFGGSMVPGFEYVEYNNVEDLVRIVEEMNVTPENDLKAGRKRGVAAIMLEALQGEGGIIPGNPEFFATARQLCDDNNALLICDEVQVGMGRSGTLWGYQQLNIEPDVFTSAKALGGGVPIGAMCAKGDAANVFSPGDHASTYGGNPLACTAALAVAQYLSDYDVLPNVVDRGEQLSNGLNKIAEAYTDILGDVRGWGLLKGIEIKKDAGVSAGELVGDAMEKGLLLVPAGPSVVRFVPPLIVSEEDIDEALSIFEEAVAKYGMKP